MSWLEKHYEKLILLLAAVALIVISLNIFRQAQGYEELFAALERPVRPSEAIRELPFEQLQSTAGRLDATPEWGVHEGFLFVSRPYIATGTGPNAQLVDPTEEDSPPIHPPVPNQWFLDYGLDILDPEILDTDTDGDGFVNRLEWEYETDPTDPESHPPYHIKLVMVRYVENPFRILVSSRTDDTFFVETLDRGGRTQIRRIGDRIEGTNFRIVDFEEKYEDRPIGDGQTRRVETSEIIVEDIETEERHTMVMQQEANFPDIEADLLLDWGNRPRVNVRVDTEFSLPPEPEVKYRVIRLSSQEAVVEKLDTEEEITVTRRR